MQFPEYRVGRPCFWGARPNALCLVEALPPLVGRHLVWRLLVGRPSAELHTPRRGARPDGALSTSACHGPTARMLGPNGPQEAAELHTPRRGARPDGALAHGPKSTTTGPQSKIHGSNSVWLWEEQAPVVLEIGEWRGNPQNRGSPGANSCRSASGWSAEGRTTP